MVQSPSVYERIVTSLLPIWKLLAHNSFKKCVVSVKYLNGYTADKRVTRVEEDLEDGELSDPDEEATTQEYETKNEVRKNIRDIITEMATALQPRSIVQLIRAEV